MVIQFNLSSQSEIKDIKKAQFSIYRSGSLVEGPYGKDLQDKKEVFDLDCQFYIHKLTADWKENDVSWEKLSNAHDPKEIDIYEYKKGFKGWVTFDVTSVVKDFLKNPSENHGFILSSKLTITNNESGNTSEFFTSEATDVEKRPKLTITADGTNINKTEQSLPDCFKVRFYSEKNHILLHISDRSKKYIKVYSITGQDITEMVCKKINSEWYTISIDKYKHHIALLKVSDRTESKVFKLNFIQ